MSSEEEGRKANGSRNGPIDWDVHAGLDATLGGYLKEHSRPPAFEGTDGEPYTVSLEVERLPGLRPAYEGYLVFPRWAATGLGVVGHLESPALLAAQTPEVALERLGEIPLLRVKYLLDEAINRGNEPDSDPRLT